MKTVFLRAIEADVDAKARVLKEAIHTLEKAMERARFEVEPAGFAVVPRSPFAYWVSDNLRQKFSAFPPFESGRRTAKCGMGTLADFRFLRLAWEFRSSDAASDSFPFAKGGMFGRYYADVHLQVRWGNNGEEVKEFVRSKVGSATRKIQAQSFYFRPGLTWPRRTDGLSFRVMPAGCIFGDKGPAIFVRDDNPTRLLALNTVINSQPFGALVALQLARTELAQSYEVGLIQRTPVPDLIPEDEATLAAIARRAWSLKRQLDTVTETSHAFVLAALLQVAGTSLSARAEAWYVSVADTLITLDRIQAEIDDRCFALYGISDEDRRSIEQGFGAEPAASAEGNPENLPPTNPEPLVRQLLSWVVGTAYGRFDVRLATNARPMLTEPEPFDPLPVCSPGMLTGDDGFPLDAPPGSYPIVFSEDGILADDPGHARDLGAAVRAVFDVVFDDGDARWHEAAELVGARKYDLRRWFAHDYFPLHIKAYSKSRRKAPIYWQLATPTASYSVWVYYHRFTRDTLFRVLHDFVTPKLQHEEAKLNALFTDAGSEPSRDQRAEIDAQETFVNELRAFKVEVARVVPLWNPDLNDGVILNFATLWRLVPQHKPWQREVKKIWDKLVAGDYDWTHLAMHLWPERVVPKCQEDRSLAIAHGLEDAFWTEDDGGKWQQRQVGAKEVETLIAERASSAVKVALDDLLSARGPAGRKTRKRRARVKRARG